MLPQQHSVPKYSDNFNLEPDLFFFFLVDYLFVIFAV